MFNATWHSQISLHLTSRIWWKTFLFTWHLSPTKECLMAEMSPIPEEISRQETCKTASLSSRCFSTDYISDNHRHILPYVVIACELIIWGESRNRINNKICSHFCYADPHGVVISTEAYIQFVNNFPMFAIT